MPDLGLVLPISAVPRGLQDTFEHVRRTGIAWVGAGATAVPAVLEASGLRLGVLGCSDHPVDSAAEEGAPGIA
jgi:poly-gamma-glutamate synthesis protein (capsule biosynthesis protein)